MNSYTYTAYGLNFKSSIPLPELTPYDGGETDITINYGEVPDSLAMPSNNGIAWQSAPDQMLLSVSEVARYLIKKNCEILVEPISGSREEDVRIFLLGSVLGALLHARKMLVLHAGVVSTKRGAVVIMGRSGAGKSTLTAAFVKRGYPLLADDKAGIFVDQTGAARAMPGFPIVRLSAAATELLQIPVKNDFFNRGIGKYVVPVENFHDQPQKIYAAYALEVHNQSDLQFDFPDNLEKFQILNRGIYRRRFSSHKTQQEAHFQTLSVLSTQTRVTLLRRPAECDTISQIVARIEEDLEK